MLRRIVFGCIIICLWSLWVLVGGEIRGAVVHSDTYPSIPPLYWTDILWHTLSFSSKVIIFSMSKSVEYERIVCQFTYFFKILVLYCGCFTLVKSSTSSGICMYFEIVCQKGTGKPKLAYDVKILKLRWLIRSNTYNIIRSPLATMQRITNLQQQKSKPSNHYKLLHPTININCALH